MTEPVDFAIVGGGASGIYSAWRLAHASDEEVAQIREGCDGQPGIGGDGPLNIAVYERSNRIGGRLLSASPATMPDTTMELGGMRYLDSQVLVKSLVEKKLKAKRHPQVVSDPDNFAYLRGKIFRQSELVQPGVDLPYGLTPAERLVVTASGTETPAKLLFWAVFKQFPELEGMNPDQAEAFLKTAKVDEKPLYEVGFWNLLSRHLSHEGRELAITAIGYDVLGANANAVDIIAENFDFQADSKYYLFDEGFESIIWTLAEEFEATGGAIQMNTSLESFDDGEDGHLQLEFDGGDTVTARAVVLAMPQAAIKGLRKKGPLLDPDRAPCVPILLNSVEGIPLYKLFVIYDTPWWNDDWQLEAGRSLTDIPVRQCYYWATNVGQTSALMAYNDQASTSFWGGYQTGPLGPGDTQQLKDCDVRSTLFEPEPVEEWHDDDVAKRRRDNWDAHKAPHELVMEMHRQIMLMHGVDDAPEPIDAAFMDWMNAPYGGAVHFWNPGYKSWEVREQMTQPVEGLHAYVVGESFSTVQTWVEGALQTSEIFLQKRLCMSPPDWVTGTPEKPRHQVIASQ